HERHEEYNYTTTTLDEKLFLSLCSLTFNTQRYHNINNFLNTTSAITLAAVAHVSTAFYGRCLQTAPFFFFSFFRFVSFSYSFFSFFFFFFYIFFFYFFSFFFFFF